MPQPRRFDHDEARRRYAAGEGAYVLAREYGVSPSAIYRIVIPGREEQMRASARRVYAAVCEGCGNPCLSHRHAAKRLRPNHDGRDLCHRCRMDEALTRIRFDPITNAIVAVRCLTIDCANGDRWQPPEHFTRGTRHRDLRDGGIHTSCRACQTRARTRNREENRERDRVYDREYRARRRAEATA